jgi:hypothetical protein
LCFFLCIFACLNLPCFSSPLCVLAHFLLVICCFSISFSTFFVFATSSWPLPFLCAHSFFHKYFLLLPCSFSLHFSLNPRIYWGHRNQSNHSFCWKRVLKNSVAYVCTVVLLGGMDGYLVESRNVWYFAERGANLLL